MAVVRERVVLRKRRSSEPKQPNRIRLDKLNPGDELVVEIVVAVSYTHLTLPTT